MNDEAGTATLELALVGPVLMLLILGILQFGLWYHAHSVVRSAALEGARQAAAEDGTPVAGESRALEVLRAGLGRAGEDPSARVSVGPEVVRIDVEARMRGLLPIPGLSSFLLKGKASVFRERFRPAGGSP